MSGFSDYTTFCFWEWGVKNNPPLPLGDINYFYSLKFKLLFNFTCAQPYCYKECKIFIAHVYFSPSLQYHSHFWKRWQVLKLAGGRTAESGFSRRLEKRSSLQKKYLPENNSALLCLPNSGHPLLPSSRSKNQYQLKWRLLSLPSHCPQIHHSNCWIAAAPEQQGWPGRQ